MNIIRKISLALIIIGALNWGLVGIFDFNLVTFLFKDSILTTITYAIIAFAGLACITYYFDDYDN
ncbi:MAG: DUF378 domain-containing protein [Candidatus Coprovivens sp.]